jgi:1-phosphatidylinositol-4-phosphate 5-kinase
VYLDDLTTEYLNSVIKKDSDYLCSQGIMDYSILLVVEKVEANQSFHPYESRNQFTSVDKKYVFHVGIIDYLQQWNFSKKVEAWWKINFKGRDVRYMSCVEPQTYKERF